MTSYLDRLNLRPFEKRLVVGVGAVLFFVLNLWFVFPHFSDWNRVKFRVSKAQRTLTAFRGEVQKLPMYQAKVREMESEGYAVPAEDQAQHFASTVQSQAAQGGVNIIQSSRITSRTNQFFLEQSQTINVQTKEEQLVNFLFNLGSGNSLIRVSDLALRPDAPRQNLGGTIKLVASYQKKATALRPAAGTPAPAPAPGAGKAGPQIPKSATSPSK